MFLSYLVSSITATDTSIEVEDGSLFPQNQVFEIWVDREKMNVTSFASANVMNVQRGWEGTLAAAHDSDVLVSLDEDFKQPVRTSKALDTHIDATDPHTGYVLESSEDASDYGFVLDEDDMASNSDTDLPTQQSVKAYVDLRLLISDIDDAPVNGVTNAPISSNWAYDHNAAILSSTVHNNTTIAMVYLGTAQSNFNAAGITYAAVEFDTKTVDVGSNYIIDNWYGASGAYRQADADSTSTKIEDNDASFPTQIKYFRVRWASNAAGDANTGEGYITATDSDTLTIVKTTGANFAASYYYWIRKAYYLVPTTGIYCVSACITYSGVVADKKYHVAVYAAPSSAFVALNLHASYTGNISVPFSGLCSLTAGQYICVYANSSDSSGVVDILSATYNTYLHIYMLRAT